MKEKTAEQKIDFLLAVRAAVKRNQVVIIILYNSEDDEYCVVSNGYGIDFDEVLSSFNEMPFLGRISTTDAFDNWHDYYDDLALAEIYGFELEDGMVQMSILDYFIEPIEHED